MSRLPHLRPTTTACPSEPQGASRRADLARTPTPVRDPPDRLAGPSPGRTPRSHRLQPQRGHRDAAPPTAAQRVRFEQARCCTPVGTGPPAPVEAARPTGSRRRSGTAPGRSRAPPATRAEATRTYSAFDQPTGVGAALAHQELSEPVEAQDAVLLEQAPQHLGLRRGDAVGFKGPGQQPVAFASITKLLGVSRTTIYSAYPNSPPGRDSLIAGPAPALPTPRA